MSRLENSSHGLLSRSRLEREKRPLFSSDEERKLCRSNHQFQPFLQLFPFYFLIFYNYNILVRRSKSFYNKLYCALSTSFQNSLRNYIMRSFISFISHIREGLLFKCAEIHVKEMLLYLKNGKTRQINKKEQSDGSYIFAS